MRRWSISIPQVFVQIQHQSGYDQDVGIVCLALALVIIAVILR